MIYGTVMRWRRRWYERHPGARRRLDRPVISVGNLTMGGSGKTPLVAHLARLLLAAGERPAILSRGYGRRARRREVVVVRDAEAVRAGLDEAGDEPLMLARALEGACVLVAPDRYRAGRLAETDLRCTVHLLDDGFQHMMLARTVDLLLLSPADAAGRLLPFGRLREPVEAAAAADAVIAVSGPGEDVAAFGRRVGARKTFRAVRRVHRPRLAGTGGVLPPGARALAVAGVAKPARFFRDVRAAGCCVAGELAFRDHHHFTPADVGRMLREARAAGAEVLLTTEKDLMRLLPYVPMDIGLAWLPLSVAVEPAAEFTAWLGERLGLAMAGTPVGD